MFQHRTLTAMKDYANLMRVAPTSKYDSCADTSMDERNQAWDDKDRIFATLIGVIRGAQPYLAKDNQAWEFVPAMTDSELIALLDPTMLDGEALREVEIHIREML